MMSESSGFTVVLLYRHCAHSRVNSLNDPPECCNFLPFRAHGGGLVYLRYVEKYLAVSTHSAAHVGANEFPNHEANSDEENNRNNLDLSRNNRTITQLLLQVEWRRHDQNICRREIVFSLLFATLATLVRYAFTNRTCFEPAVSRE